MTIFDQQPWYFWFFKNCQKSQLCRAAISHREVRLTNYFTCEHSSIVCVHMQGWSKFEDVMGRDFSYFAWFLLTTSLNEKKVSNILAYISQQWLQKLGIVLCSKCTFSMKQPDITTRTNSNIQNQHTKTQTQPKNCQYMAYHLRNQEDIPSRKHPALLLGIPYVLYVSIDNFQVLRRLWFQW